MPEKVLCGRRQGSGLLVPQESWAQSLFIRKSQSSALTEVEVFFTYSMWNCRDRTWYLLASTSLSFWLTVYLKYNTAKEEWVSTKAICLPLSSPVDLLTWWGHFPHGWLAVLCPGCCDRCHREGVKDQYLWLCTLCSHSDRPGCLKNNPFFSCQVDLEVWSL